MKRTAGLSLTAAGAVALLALTGCAANEGGSGSSAGSESSLSGTLTGSGASSQGSAQEAWIAGFQEANPDVTVNYDPAGSGTGRETFQSGAAAFAGSDRAFNDEEIASGEFASCKADTPLVEIPAYISPIAIVFNVEGVDSLNLDAATIAGIFSGKITKWNDPAIADQNPDANLPDLAISAVHRSDKSGTTENFTEYLSAAAADVWTVGAIEEWPSEFGGEGAAQTSGMVSAVQNGQGTIGYADASRAGDLGTVHVKVGEEYVEYTPEAAAKIVEHSKQVEGREASDMALEIDRTTSESGVYPIVLVSYLIGCTEYEDAANAELAKAYLGYVVSADGQKVAADAAGSAPLSEAMSKKAEEIIAGIK